MAWIPTNYKGKSANKERGDENVFKYIKKKKGPKTVAGKITGLAKAIKKFNKI